MASKLDLTTEDLVRICRTWTPESLVLFYNWIQRRIGVVFPDHLWPVALALCDVRIKKLMLQVGPGAGKALHPDTPVLTPTGMLPIGKLRVGDQVMNPDGISASRVQAVWPQELSKLYRVTFADGREIRAHAGHLWQVYNKKFRIRPSGAKWRLRTTEEIATYASGSRGALRWYVPLMEPLDGPTVTLPLDPYLLGTLLGDGHIGPGGFATLTCFDEESVERIRIIQARTGLDISAANRAPGHFGVLGLGKALSALGLAGSRSWNKFIPYIYKTASAAQRWALIQGLFDTDGTVSSETSNVSYTTTSLQLAKDVQALVWSLGGIATMSNRIPKFTHLGEKREGKRAYTIHVRHRDLHNFFQLARKIARTRVTQYSDDLKLEITGIELEPEASPSVCISVTHPEGLFVAGDYVVTHNSQMLSIVYAAWLLGHKPTERILTISGAEDLASGFMSGVMGFIKESPEFALIFPHVKPDKEKGWSAGGMYVTGHPTGIPDASYYACGLTSRALTGKHGSTIILDDLHSPLNSSTPEQCAEVIKVYNSNIVGRADPMGARFLLAGRRWHTNDLYGVMEQNEDWVVLRLPAERTGMAELWFDIYVPDKLECVFTDGICFLGDGDMVPIVDRVPPAVPLQPVRR